MRGDTGGHGGGTPAAGTSFESTLHPRAGAAFLILWTVVCLAVPDPLNTAALFAGGQLLLLGARRADLCGRVWLLALVFLPTSLLINMLFGQWGETVLFTLPWGKPVYQEALTYGIVMLINIGAVTQIFLITTQFCRREDALNEVLNTLPQWGVLLTTALNTWPCMRQQFQRSRFCLATRLPPSLPPLKKTLAHLQLWRPLLHHAIESSSQAAIILHTRGFGTGPRTRYGTRPWRGRDSLTTALSLAAGLLALTPWFHGPAASLLRQLAGAGLLLILLLAHHNPRPPHDPD